MNKVIKAVGIYNQLKRIENQIEQKEGELKRLLISLSQEELEEYAKKTIY